MMVSLGYLSPIIYIYPFRSSCGACGGYHLSGLDSTQCIRNNVSSPFTTLLLLDEFLIKRWMHNNRRTANMIIRTIIYLVGKGLQLESCLESERS